MKENNEDNYVDKVYVDLEDLIEGEIYLMEHSNSECKSTIIGMYNGNTTDIYNLVNPNSDACIAIKLISINAGNGSYDAHQLPIGSIINITGVEHARFIKL